jgi:hypothetical protein
MFSFVLLILEWKSKRYVEYWPFWAVLSGIFLAGPYLEEKIFSVKKSLINFRISALLASLVLFVVISINYSRSQIFQGLSDTRAFFNVEAARGANEYLIENSAHGDIVFTDDWDVFPLYFFLNQKNYYIVGLDPEFMNKYDSSLFNEFSAISSGKDASNLGRIKQDFKAKWVIVASDHPAFKSNLKNNPDLFNEAYSGGGYTVFSVK